MDTLTTQKNTFEEISISVNLKLATLWAGLMFLYIYVDYLHLYMHGTIASIEQGKVFEFNISQDFLLIAIASMTIPTLMIFLSVVLRANVNRCANIIIAILYIPFTLFNLAGEVWIHMVFAAFVEVIILCLIIRYAWKWPLVKEF